MYQAVANVTTADAYGDTATVRLPGTVRIVLQVANSAVFYQLDESEEGKGLWTAERFLSPSIGSLDRRCSGIRFRSAVAGRPAQVSCELADEDEVTGAADSLGAFTSTITPAGVVEPLPDSGLTLAYTEFTAAVVISATTENGATLIVTASAITFDGSTIAFVEFFAPEVQLIGNAAGNQLSFWLYENGVSIGRISVYQSVGTTTEVKEMRPGRRLTPASGARTYSIRAHRTNADCNVLAGGGGGGTDMPGWIRVTREANA